MAADLLSDRRIPRGLISHNSIQKATKALLKSNAILVEPMEKLSNQDKKKSIRRTITEQEEIFRHQVHELHRLYQVQKSLMADLGSKNHKFSSTLEIQEIKNMVKNGATTSEVAQGCNPAPCLSLFGDETSTVQINMVLERSVDDDNSIGGKDWSTCAESDLDLKLSIGPSSQATRTRH